MKKLISLILTFTLSFSTIYCTHCFAYKPTTAQDKTINIKAGSLNETRSAVDKIYGSIPRKTSTFKKILGAAAAVATGALSVFAIFKTFIQKYSNDQNTPYVLNTEYTLENTDADSNSMLWTGIKVIKVTALGYVLACVLACIYARNFA